MLLVNGDILRGENWSFDKDEIGIVHESAEKPDEWLFELIVGLGGDVVVLEVLLSVESNLLGLDFSILDVDLVTDQHDWDSLANTGQVLIPLRNIGVGDTGAGVEHNDTALSTDIVSITETSEFFLTGSVPHVEFALAVVSEELHWVDFDTECSNVLLLEFAC